MCIAVPPKRKTSCVCQVCFRNSYSCCDKKAEALLGMGAAGVAETLLRTMARNPFWKEVEDAGMILAQVLCSRQCSRQTSCPCLGGVFSS